MRTPGRKTSKKRSLPESQQNGEALPRWHAPNINYPKQKRFCQTKEDFFEEYGLSLEGENPRCLSDADVPESQWVTVFTHEHVNNKKIHLKSLRPEFYEECALLYHMVYQTIPPNNEITVNFARGFAFEKCRLAQSPTHKAKHKVAWAVFAESVIKNVTLQKNLQTKIALWRARNNLLDASTISASHVKQDSLDTSLWGGPSRLGRPCSQYDKADLLQPACLVHVDLAVDMVTAANKKLQEKKNLVEDCRTSIDEAKTKRDKAGGVRGAAEALLQKINKAKEELQALEGEGDEAALWRLRAEILGCQVALDLLGPDVCSPSLDKAVDELQDRHNCLLKEVQEANAQLCFVNHLVKQVEMGQVPALALRPPIAHHGVKGTLLIQDECVACGLSIEDSEVMGVYMLSCRHPYHPLCFATLCYTREECSQIGCSQSIPRSTQQMMLGCCKKLSKQSMSKVDALCEEAKVVMHLTNNPLSRKHGHSIGSSGKPVLQPEPLSIVPVTLDGTGLSSIGGEIEGNTLNSHGGVAGGEGCKGEIDNVEVQGERRNCVKELSCNVKECCLAELSVAAAITDANGKDNGLQHADAGHNENDDAFQHVTLNQLANMGTKRRKGILKEKISKKHKKWVPANIT